MCGIALLTVDRLVRSIGIVWILLASGAGVALGQETSIDAREVERLIRQLNDDRAAAREQAEARLLELGGIDPAGFLEHLPEATSQMPVAVRERLARIRKQVEQQAAMAAVAASRITLQADSMPLAEVLKALEEQTGNRFIDNRAEFGQEARDFPLTFAFEHEPFWSALDQILDQAQLDIYNFAGQDALALVERDQGAASRYGAATYSGPFRLQVVEVQAQRNLRKPQQTSLKLAVEVAWEPRLKPIALTQALADLTATGSGDHPLQLDTQLPVLQHEVPTGTQATELVIPMELPPRSVTEIAQLKGTLTALVPGRQAEFRFDNLAEADGKTQSQAGVYVTLDSVRKNNEIWELSMRMRLDEANRALESHRGWVFQNPSFLVGADGEPIEYAGLETTRQTQNEVGITYLFDLPEGLDGISWVYKTPAAIIELPVTYELKGIELP